MEIPLEQIDVIRIVKKDGTFRASIVPKKGVIFSGCLSKQKGFVLPDENFVFINKDSLFIF